MTGIEGIYNYLAQMEVANNRRAALRTQGVFGPAAEQQMAKLAFNDLENQQRSQYAAQEEARQDERAKKKQDEARAAQQPSGNSGKPVTPEQKWMQGVLNQSKPTPVGGTISTPPPERRPGDTGPALGGVTKWDVANFGKYGMAPDDGQRISGANNAPGTIGSEPQQPGMTSVNALTKAGVLSTEERSNLKRFGKAIGRPVNPNAQFKVPDANVQGYMDQFFRR